jgi:regulator of sigma E protease
MDILFGVILGLIVLVVLVVLHELGHAIVARRNGVGVEEFGIGFPPRAWGKKLKNGILFSVNWLPLGGFVRLQGEHDSAAKKGDYGNAPFWQKTKILFAGVVVNWLVAAILLTVLAWTGLPRIIDNQFTVASDTTIVASPVVITGVIEDYPAAQSGIAEGDIIVSVQGEPIDTSSELADVTASLAGQTVPIVYERNDVEQTVDVALRDAESGVFGVTLGQQELIQATWSAPIVGVVSTAQFTWVTLQGLGQLVGDFFSGLFLQLSPDQAVRTDAGERLDRASNSVAGPIGILGIIFPAAGESGPRQVLLLTAIISLTLAVMNALPIPALDGGRWFVTALFRVLKRPLTKDREERIQGTGFLVLMGLIIVVTVGDVAKLFS